MENFFYPAPEIQPVRQSKWEPWNKLRTGTPGRRNINPKKSYQNVVSMKNQILSAFSRENFSNQSKNSFDIQNIKTTDIQYATQQRKSSILSLEDLLLLENDLFSEKKQLKYPHSYREIMKKIEITDDIHLKGKKINFTRTKIVRPKDHNFLMKKSEPSAFHRVRSTSVSKTKRKIKIQETPTPWGNDKSTETLNKSQKQVPQIKSIGFQDNFTSTSM